MNFETAIDYVIRNEGGYVDHPNDKGGKTRYGITRLSFQDYYDREPKDGEIENLTLTVAKEIYHQNYWLKNSCDKITCGSLATVVLDSGVLFGTGTAARAVQETLKGAGFPLVRVDGKIGPVTLAAINSIDPTTFIYSFKKLLTDRVLKIIEKSPELAVFKRGWFSRLNRMTTLK